MGKIQSICVFSSSSDKLDHGYYDMAEELGRAMAEEGVRLVFGGGRFGLMGACARGVSSLHGRITGVIPEKLHQPGVASPACTDLIVTQTMHERKKTMEELSDAFIALPGGFGTLEELLEVITLKQLGYHDKPIVLLNYEGFFRNMLEQFEVLFATGFSHMAYRQLYHVAPSPRAAIDAIVHYCPVTLPDKMQEALQGACAP